MDRDRQERYQIVTTGPRRVRGAEARKRIQRELHGVVCQTPVPVQHRAFLYDLRRQRRQVYGTLLRFLDISIRQGVAMETLLQIPQWIDAYIREQFDDQPSRAA